MGFYASMCHACFSVSLVRRAPVAFRAVLEREGRVEEAPLEAHARGERRLVRGGHGLLRELQHLGVARSTGSPRGLVAEPG